MSNLYETDFKNGNMIPADVTPQVKPFVYNKFGHMRRGNNGFSSGMPPDAPDAVGLKITTNHNVDGSGKPTPNPASESTLR